MVPEANNLFKKTHTLSSENYEAKEGRSREWLTVQKSFVKLKYA